MQHIPGTLAWAVPALFLLAAVVLLARPDAAASPAPKPASAAKSQAGGTPGSLAILGKDGAVTGICPLKHTDVRGAISGFLARVTVTQVFENTATNNIEAVYVFPLPDEAAVDDMTIRIGDRTVRGLIKKRQEAREIYENAKRTGHIAALLDQERPNIFTQSVANILPGEQVSVTISYLETLDYKEGSYEFVFPMVVGPRYIPGDATGQQSGGWSPDTNQVPDASRITPPVTPKGTRAGHDISLQVAIDAGVPIQELRSVSHQIDVERPSVNAAVVKLRNESEIPNKDFILRYDVAGAKIEDAILTQSTSPKSKLGPGGYFTLILQPPARVPESDITPKELVFVLDTSGSMMGFPLDKAKQLVNRALDELYPGDTFNLITFSGDTQILFPEPVYPTADNIRRARKFLESRSGSGGTEMMKAIRAALDPSDAQDHLRIVCFVTDGYVGNDMEIIGEVQKHPNARVFSFGIGSSVNRFLLDGMAKAGRGEVQYVTLPEKADAAAHRLYDHLRSPLLTDISIDWAGLPVSEVYPARFPDLFSGKPLVITGRYTGAAKGVIRLRGKRAGENFVREIPVDFSSTGNIHDVLPAFWARQKIDSLMSQDWQGMQGGAMKPELEQQITQLGLDYRLMTQFTSFVAVEEQVVTRDGQPQTIQVPVEMPEGVSYEGVFGADERAVSANQTMGLSASIPMLNSGAGFGGRIAGVFTGHKMAAAPPPPPRPTSQLGESDTVAPSVPLAKVTPERALLESKLTPGLLRTFDCWKAGGSNCSSIQAGKVEIRIVLASAKIPELKGLGFELQREKSSGRILVGHLPMEHLEALARLAEVKFVSLIPR